MTLAETCLQAQAEVLILAGDLTTFMLPDFVRVLREFSYVAPLRLCVAGNHDIWTSGGRRTLRRYRKTLPELCERFGYRLLDAGPVRADREGIGFVGGLGWYDYSLRQFEEPVRGVRVSPARPSRRSSFSRVKVISGREDLAWSELREEDFRGKALVWREDDNLRSLVWNDALYVSWPVPDEQVVAWQVQHLKRSAEELGDVERLVVVTHTVPFREAFSQPYSRVSWAYCRAYMGSAALGEALVGDPRLAIWITGHVHYQVEVECQGVKVVNVAAAPEQKDKSPTLIEVTDDGVTIQRLTGGEG